MKERKKLSNALLGSAEMVGEKLGSGHPEAACSVGRSPASMFPAGCPHPASCPQHGRVDLLPWAESQEHQAVQLGLS